MLFYIFAKFHKVSIDEGFPMALTRKPFNFCLTAFPKEVDNK